MIIFLLLIGALLITLLGLLIKDVFAYNKNKADLVGGKVNMNPNLHIGQTNMDDRLKPSNANGEEQKDELLEQLNQSVSSHRSNKSARSGRSNKKSQKRDLGYGINGQDVDEDY